MRIVALVENTSNSNMTTEHGLSLYIETEKHRILFDSGQSTLFARNADKLGVDLSTVDICFLSHGHYDHGGGLMEFTRINSKAPIYMSDKAFGLQYDGSDKYVGLDRSWLEDRTFMKRIVFTEGDVKLDDELEILAPRTRVIDMGNAGLYVKKGSVFFPDDFSHEQYLMVRLKDKRVLISGCSHQGIINIVEWFSPDVLVGGFHFMTHFLDDELLEYARRLDSYDTEYYTCHCTGPSQYRFIKNEMKRLRYLSEGEEIIL